VLGVRALTLTVCLQGIDGLVLASDSRGTFGDPRNITAQNDTMKKIYSIRKVGILLAGTPQANMIIEDAAKQVEEKNFNNATEIMEMIRGVARAKFNEWYPSFPLMPVPNQNQSFVRPNVQLTVVGYDISSGQSIPRIYSMVSNLDFAPNLHDFGFCLGGVPQYALYLLNRLYSRDMKVENLKHLAAYVVTETATQDGKVGGPVQMAVIDTNGSHLIDEAEIHSIIEKNETKSKGLKNFFGGEL
jgi:20S proteasome alpha/beta subunit